MATRPTLPYFASPDSLPAPLPSLADILASDQIIKDGGLTKVVRVGEHFVVKHGLSVQLLQEGENMLFVQQSTSIRVPTVYALFNDPETQRNFIVQEFIAGRMLGGCWGRLDRAEKEAIVSQLRQYFNELRALPSPGYFGGVWKQPILDFNMTGYVEKSSFPPVLPCETEEEWVEAMLRIAQELYAIEPSRYQWMKRMLRDTFQGHEPVFTHGDIHGGGNMMVCDDLTVVLIDWQFAGWHPSCWEYASLMAVSDWDSDWPAWVPQFLQEWPVETGWMCLYRLWQMGCW